MKKVLLLFLFLFCLQAFALDEMQDVGIAKYAVLETILDYVPLREKDDENAKRITHLSKNVILFADKQNKNYFRVELEEDKYAWVNKKYVEVQAIIPEKRLEDIQKISYKEDKKYRFLEIETLANTTNVFEENKNGLNFTMYDVNYDPSEVKFNKNIDFQIDKEKINNKFTFNYNGEKLFGYDSEKTKNGIVVTIKKAPKINKKKPLDKIRITLDAGHGGEEKGACAFNLEEKDINLQIVKILKKELNKKGAKVYLTRKKDVKVDLYKRPEIAKSKESDILISIHQNSLPNPKDIDKKHGVGVYYYHNQSKPLAQKLQENLVLNTGFRDDSVNHASFVLTRPTSQISVLVECGYIIKQDEAEKLKDKKFQKIIAKAIVKGCEDYLKENFL